MIAYNSIAAAYVTHLVLNPSCYMTRLVLNPSCYMTHLVFNPSCYMTHLVLNPSCYMTHLAGTEPYICYMIHLVCSLNKIVLAATHVARGTRVNDPVPPKAAGLECMADHKCLSLTFTAGVMATL